ncbi:MAG TPA: hypothetical protein VGK99_22610 [Acidobacteriota bacterium]|jgi:hypothetical protein
MTNQNRKDKDRAGAKRSAGPRIQGDDSQARRIATAILEVLGGERTPTQAAQALGISVMHYYHLESRALAAFVTGCQSRAKGRTKSPHQQLHQLSRQLEKLKLECARKSALLRAARQAVGLAPPLADKTGKRRRRPTVRALRAACRLQTESQTENSHAAAISDPGGS